MNNSIIPINIRIMEEIISEYFSTNLLLIFFPRLFPIKRNIEPNIKVQTVVEITLTPVMLAAIPAAILFNDSVSIIAINSLKVM